MVTPLEVLAKSRYVLLTTFRRDGTGVATPVWAVRVGDELRIWTNPSAGKVKRLRRDPRALIAPCTARGRPLGASIEVSGRVLTAEQAQEVLLALVAKYGWQARLTLVRDQLMRRIGRPSWPVGAIAVQVPAGT